MDNIIPEQKPKLKPLPPLDEDEEIEAGQMTYNFLLEDTVFFCDYPLLDLEQRIEEQFTNLIDMEDDTNFFQIALNGFKYSLEVIEVEFDEYTLERREILRNKYQQFINFMVDLIERKLTISIPDYETALLSRQEVEFLIEKIYHFFVLKGRKNFKKVIAKQLEKDLTPLATALLSKTYQKSDSFIRADDEEKVIVRRLTKNIQDLLTITKCTKEPEKEPEKPFRERLNYDKNKKENIISEVKEGNIRQRIPNIE